MSEIEEIQIQTYQPIQGMIICISGGSYVLTTELEKEKERTNKAEERVKQLENAIDEWTKLYHSLQEHADEMGRIISSQTDVRIEKEAELERAEVKVKELDDRIEKLVLVIDEYAMRITKAESRLKKLVEAVEGWRNGELSDGAALIVIYDILNPSTPDEEDIKWAKESLKKEKVLEEVNSDLEDYASPNLLVEQLTERIKELEAQLASIKADESIGKLEVADKEVKGGSK